MFYDVRPSIFDEPLGPTVADLIDSPRVRVAPRNVPVDAADFASAASPRSRSAVENDEIPF